MMRQARDLEKRLVKLEFRTKELAEENQNVYDQIRELEDTRVPELNVETSKHQYMIDSQNEKLKCLENQKLELLAKNEELSQKITEHCGKKSKVSVDLKESLEHCQELKDSYQKLLKMEEIMPVQI